jgi:membrane fusion protein, multidrug efflux system
VNKARLVFFAALLAFPAGVVADHVLKGSTETTAPAAAARDDSGARAGSRSAQRGAPPVAVVTAVAESKDVPITRDAVGWVEPIASVAVRPRLDGEIVDVAVSEGDVVKENDVLFRLDDAALQAMVAKDQANIDKDQANLDQAKADLQRDTSLASYKNAVTEQQLQQQQALVDADTATVALDKAQLRADQVQLSYATITAPIAGRIGVVNVTKGAVVRAADTTSLLTITQMAPLRVSFTIPERDLDAFRQALASSPPASVNAIGAQSGASQSSGTLTFIDSNVDTSSGTVTVKADFGNADGALWPGEYVKVECQLGVHHAATVVPLAAVQLNENGSFVYLVKAGGKVAAQKVTLTDSTDGAGVVGSGVSPGDHVVVEGQLRLHDGSLVKETPATVAAAEPSAPTPTPDRKL